MGLPTAHILGDLEPSLPGPVVQLGFAAEPLSCALPGDSQGSSGPSPQAVGQSELPGPLWDPADPPAKAHSAWQAPRSSSKEARGTRFPSRLPPLSGLPPIASLSSKKLRDCCRKATPVTEVSFLP